MAARTFDRSPWLLEPGVSFLNHGSFGACPEPVLEAQRAWRDRLEREPVRFLHRELESHLDVARHDVAAFLGADPDSLAFVPNTTTGVSTVLASRRFNPGDELLACDHEYNATLNALRAAAARDGATVVLVRVPFPVTDPSQVVEAFLEAVTPRTRLALVSHVTSPTALVMPVTALVRELDRRGVDTLVDGAHAPGMLTVNLDELGAAYWTGNGHKWLCAPKGSGVLHVRADLRAGLRPLVVSHAANTERTDRSRFHLGFDWTGTGDPTPYLAMPAAIRFVGGLHEDGWPGLMAANAALARVGAGPTVRGPGRPMARAGRDARLDGSGATPGRCADRCRGGAAPGRPVRRGPDRGPGARVPGPGRSRGRRRPGAGARPDQRPALQPAGGVCVAGGAARRAGPRRPLAEVAPGPAAPGLMTAPRCPCSRCAGPGAGR